MNCSKESEVVLVLNNLSKTHRQSLTGKVCLTSSICDQKSHGRISHDNTSVVFSVD